jgi:hypothetical protein
MTSPLTHLAMIAVLLGGGTYAATPSTSSHRTPSISSHRTPPQRDAGTLAALVDPPSTPGEPLVVRPAFVDGRIVQINVRADAPNVREDRGITAG